MGVSTISLVRVVQWYQKRAENGNFTNKTIGLHYKRIPKQLLHMCATGLQISCYHFVEFRETVKAQKPVFIICYYTVCKKNKNVCMDLRSDSVKSS